ncbi:flagellar protein FlgN [Criibacterium bergeronii]|uniref:Flagellar protein FlgN n=1 Tax=Criibacterium bergeronii TaxID=1871336 RepID=A0A371IK83_9FIRM|nr:flagellar protein FlgN [Criibacterium bergeronii]MBS6062874.1 flagellar protein FlgN [Peptostreptococcaceae bacterium]RDY20876.1 flagellar protein FlgN [Criibacterium bergeronii]
MDSQQYNSLVDTFKNQLQATNELITLAGKKMMVIQNNDTSELLEITNKEEKLAAQIINLEKIRDSIIKEEEKAQGKKITNIRTVIDTLSQEKSMELAEIAKQLKNSMEMLKDQNDVNKDLILFILEEIEIANNLLVGDAQMTTYNDIKGKTKNNVVGGSLFDSKY